MIRIKQLQQKVNKLVEARNNVGLDIPDPLYIAWMVDTVFDGGVPPEELRSKFPEVMSARKSRPFRTFWSAYKEAKAAISGFQIVPMGITSNSTRKKYHTKFLREHPKEVPF